MSDQIQFHIVPVMKAAHNTSLRMSALTGVPMTFGSLRGLKVFADTI